MLVIDDMGLLDNILGLFNMESHEDSGADQQSSS